MLYTVGNWGNRVSKLFISGSMRIHEGEDGVELAGIWISVQLASTDTEFAVRHTLSKRLNN